jgi:acetolactate synthase-1/2/3 large subunit
LEIGRNYPTKVGIHSDAKLALKALIQAWEESGFEPVGRKEWLRDIAQWKKEWKDETANLVKSDMTPLHYGRIVSDASEVINDVDPQTAIVCDTGMVMNWLPAFFEIRHPYFTTCNQQFGQMGFAPPGMIGCRLARPEHPVVAFCGDQSFIMTGMALATATEYDIPAVIIVLNNKTIQAEVEGAMAKFGRTIGDHYKIQRTGELWNPDISMIGKALRADVYDVNKAQEFKPALNKALRSNRLSLLNVETDRTQKRYAVPIILKHGTMPFPYEWHL